MQPHLDLACPRSLVDFICSDSGKRTIFLGIDECLNGEPILPSLLRYDITQLIIANVPSSIRVIPIVSSLSIDRIGKYWYYDSRCTRGDTIPSGRCLDIIPLPPIDSRRILATLPTDFLDCFNEREKETIKEALVFTGGHPRSVAVVLAQVEATRNKRLSDPKATLPLESFDDLVRVFALFLTHSFTHTIVGVMNVMWCDDCAFDLGDDAVPSYRIASLHRR